MKKAIKALLHGVKAVVTALVGWATSLLGMNDDSKFARILRRTIGTAATVFVVTWTLSVVWWFGQRVYRNVSSARNSENHEVYECARLSSNITYFGSYYGNNGYLENAKGKKVLKNIEWVYSPNDGDSLACFSNGSQRGYFHVSDGRLVVPPTYDHAWIFSEGLAAVDKGGSVSFINSAGLRAFNNSFVFKDLDYGYVFHDGYCAVRDSSTRKMGFIDHNGQWTLSPAFDEVIFYDSVWLAKVGDTQMVLGKHLDTVIQPINAEIEVTDNFICLSFNDHSVDMYSLQGELITKNSIRSVEQMMYETREVERQSARGLSDVDETYYVYSDYQAVKDIATCLRYEVDGSWYGLMTRDGRQLTPPLYSSIEAIGKDLYLCSLNYTNAVLLDSHGRRVE